MVHSKISRDHAAEQEELWYGSENPVYCVTPSQIAWILLTVASLLLPMLGKYFR